MINHVTKILRNENIIIEMKLFHENAHKQLIITGTQIGINCRVRGGN